MSKNTFPCVNGDALSKGKRRRERRGREEERGESVYYGQEEIQSCGTCALPPFLCLVCVLLQPAPPPPPHALWEKYQFLNRMEQDVHKCI